MPTRKKRWLKAVATHRSSLYAKRVMTLCVGASLFVGGATEAFDDVHFSVEKDLDKVNVVRKKGTDQSLVATLEGKYTSNSVYKLARLVPDRFVTQQLNLFNPEWLPVVSIAVFDPVLDAAAPTIAENRLEMVKDVKTLAKDISIINDSIRQEFFKTIPFGELIHRKAEKYDVDPILMAAIMEQESRFKPRAKSPVGARGLMQLMPRTGSWMGARNLYDPEQNVDAGAKYLRYLDKRFKGDTKKVIAAYNAGEGNVMKYRGTPPFRETRQYVVKVADNYSKRQRQLAAFSAKNGRDLR